MRVRFLVSREVLEQMFCLGDRRIVDIAFAETGYPIEPTAQVTFTVDAPDAPEGATDMEPTYERAADGFLAMVEPGWVVR
jgi:hypothetical protein